MKIHAPGRLALLAAAQQLTSAATWKELGQRAGVAHARELCNNMRAAGQLVRVGKTESPHGGRAMSLYMAAQIQPSRTDFEKDREVGAELGHFLHDWVRMHGH